MTSIKRSCIIYGLFDTRPSRFGELRYIGQSSRGLQRPRSHFCPSTYINTKSHAKNWIRACKTVNCTPDIFILEELSCETLLDDAECFWIASMRFIGCDLVNSTDGGHSTRGYKATDSLRALRRKQALGRVISPETRKRMSESMRGIKRSEGAKQLMSNMRKGIKPEKAIVASAKARTGRTLSEETRNKISMKNKGKIKPPSVGLAVAEANRKRVFSKEQREKMSQAGKRRWELKRKLETNDSISSVDLRDNVHLSSCIIATPITE